MMRLLVTGGAGFIGSNFIRHMLGKYDYKITNLDKLTYAGNSENLADVAKNSRYRFVKGDICDARLVAKLAKECDAIVNFAAESHVDRSIGDPASFLKTDVYGAHVLLEEARNRNIRLLQVSTDEVYGSVQKGSFSEDSQLNPSSPYAASKAAADLLCRSYFTTYGTDVVITRSSNNFGQYQYPEKIIPLFITNAIEDRELPVYGDGKQVRDWLYVLDNCAAIDLALHKGNKGEVYNIGGGSELENIKLTREVLKLLKKPGSLIKYVKDRPGHDRRYSLNCRKIKALGWKPQHSFSQAISLTVDWYLKNQRWWKRLKSGEFIKYYREHYYGRHGLESAK